MTKNTLHWLGLFVCFTCFFSFSQINNFKQWSIKDGLPQSTVYCIKQDKRGYIWIGTNGGLCCFDGRAFKTFTKKDGLAGNTVRALLIDSEEKIWIGTEEGISIYDGFSFRSLKKNDGLSGSTVLCFLEDHLKVIWAGTDDGGLNRISRAANGKFNIEVYNDTKGLTNNSVFDLIQHQDKSIWIATLGGGINIITQKSKSAGLEIIKPRLNIPSEMLLCFAEDGFGDLWVGSYDNGAFKIDPWDTPEKTEVSVSHYNSDNGLSSNSIWKIICAKNGDLWLGSTENGITRIGFDKNSKILKIKHYSKEEGLSSNQILSFLEDRENNIWIGTNGSGICMSTGDYFSHYFEKAGKYNDLIQGIQQDGAGNFWLASSSGGVAKTNFDSGNIEIFNERSGFPSNNTSCVAIGNSSNRNVWIGTTAKGLIKYDGKRFVNYTPKDGLINERVYSLCVDSKGIVWVGTAAGISRYDGVRFLNISTEKMKMQNDGVKAVIEDKKGNTWFATSGGIARYSGDGILRTFDQKEGLSSIDANAIVSSENGDIWIGTNAGGLYKFDHIKNDSNAISLVANDDILLSNSIHSLIFENDSTLIIGTYKGFDKLGITPEGVVKKIKHYSSSDGFLGLECNDNSIYKDNSGNIWFGTVKGLTKYDPHSEMLNKLAPTLQITGIQLFYKDINWKEKADSVLPWFYIPASLTLPYDENHLTFKFSAISFKNTEKINYKYMLEGRDKEWSPAKEANDITYSGIEPGTYTFNVKAENENGIWSDPVRFSFTIKPPWYKTTLFYVLSCITIILIIYGVLKYRERKLIHEKQVLEEIVKERTHEVMVQKEHLAEKNKEITDSINYAKGIQNSMLPPMTDIKKAWHDIFVFFQPKDIVSGDFYWFQSINENEFLIACADCTGHGVPGGFMSMVCSDKLHEAAKESKEPAQILFKTNNAVKVSLRQQIHVEGKSKDGMEVCLLRVNTQTRRVSYAGANRLLWILNGKTKEITEVKPTKASIASFTEFNFEYLQNEFFLNEGDLLYTTSDGYPDQFGGPDGKKYMSKKLKNLIQEFCHLPMEEQYVLFKNDINGWMEGHEQVDDLLLIGIRL
jgi:ligand-binding sensor domain-containing protein/serine phosphatase RsbU (regulator of sigma subunit)